MHPHRATRKLNQTKRQIVCNLGAQEDQIIAELRDARKSALKHIKECTRAGIFVRAWRFLFGR